MKYVPPLNALPGDEENDNRSYWNADPNGLNEAAQQGAYPSAAFFNALLGEVMNVITGAGLAPDQADLTQLHTAISQMISDGQSTYDIATEAMAIAGVDNEDIMTALRVKQAIDARLESITLGTKTTLSGTAVDFTGIPAGVKQVNVMFKEVSTTGTDRLTVQLGSAGGFETSNYYGATQTDGVTGTPWSNGCVAVQNLNNGGGVLYSGLMILSLMDAASNLWAINSNCSRYDVPRAYYGAGHKQLAGVLDRIRITTSAGSNTFDEGEVNISWEA